MEHQVARCSDGSIAVVTRIVNRWAYGDLITPDGQRIRNLPMSIGALISQGEWELLPGFYEIGELYPPLDEDTVGGGDSRPW